MKCKYPFINDHLLVYHLCCFFPFFKKLSRCLAILAHVVVGISLATTLFTSTRNCITAFANARQHMKHTKWPQFTPGCLVKIHPATHKRDSLLFSYVLPSICVCVRRLSDRATLNSSTKFLLWHKQTSHNPYPQVSCHRSWNMPDHGKHITWYFNTPPWQERNLHWSSRHPNSWGRRSFSSTCGLSLSFVKKFIVCQFSCKVWLLITLT